MEFRDIKLQYKKLKPQIDEAVSHTLSNACFIGGTAVHELEESLAAYVGKKYCITCANGTDALTLALKAWGTGPGDAVFVPDFTFFASGEAPACEGAVPVFVDIEKDTYNMDAACLEEAVNRVMSKGTLTPKAVIAVDLFGQPAEYDRILEVCRKYGMYLLEDGAQGFGGAVHGRMACSFGDISTTSFFPAKPLGCYGDGGAVFTDRADWAGLLRSIAVHGKNAEDKYDNIRLGMNSRLDTLQAAVLQVKLRAFRDYELEAVNQAAEWYGESLSGTGLELPAVRDSYRSSWAQYTVRLPEDVDRDRVQEYLKQSGIPTMVYYKKPMHAQGAFSSQNSECIQADCPVTEDACHSVLSLPIHPYISRRDIKNVAEALGRAVENKI